VAAFLVPPKSVQARLYQTLDLNSNDEDSGNMIEVRKLRYLVRRVFAPRIISAHVTSETGMSKRDSHMRSSSLARALGLSVMCVTSVM